MKLKVIKGVNQIGGCMTEITSKLGTKILIDFGKDLEEKDDCKPDDFELDGLTKGEKKYDAVFITHSHGDHIGLVYKLLKDIDVYIDSKSLLIHNITCDFVKNSKKIVGKVHEFDVDEQKTVCINNDIKVTPYFVDHSAYNSCMFLIEADGKKILHTGDFRGHGRKRDKFIKSLNKIGDVDVLLTEGTSLSRRDGKYKTEEELEIKAKEEFSKYKTVLIMQSSTNIDRLNTFYNARGNKNFVMDTFSNAIASKLIDAPKYGMDNIYLWHPNVYKKKKESFKNVYMTDKTNYEFMPSFIMLVKQSMIYEIRKMVKNHMIIPRETLLVYSLWNGYIEKEKELKDFIDELRNMGMHYNDKLHTSGHSDKTTLNEFSKKVNSKVTYVIHTDDNVSGEDVFKNYKRIIDGMEYDIN